MEAAATRAMDELSVGELDVEDTRMEECIRRSRLQIPNCRSSVKERRSHVAWSRVEQELELERLSLEEIGGSMLPDTTRFSSECTVTIGSCRDEVTSLLPSLWNRKQGKFTAAKYADIRGEILLQEVATTSSLPRMLDLARL